MDNLQEFNYTTTDRCDGCKKRKEGTMFHAHDAMGLATPVLFLCYRCNNPYWFDKVWRTVVRNTKKVWKYVTTSCLEQQAVDVRKERIRKRLAEIRARRATS